MNIETRDLVLLVLGVLLGLPPAIFISRYYFKQSFRKVLTPYLMFHASPMSGMSKTVRDKLNIEFRERKVENLIEAQFVVVNDGEKSIRDLIEPLTLRWHPDVRVLDAEIVQSHPANLSTQIHLLPKNESPTEARLSFDLLNAGEWFILKVIADGPAEGNQWNWSIVSDELPRSLELRRLTLDDLSDLPVETKDRYIYSGLSIAGVALTWGIFQFVSWLSEWGKVNAAEGSLLSFGVGALVFFLVIAGTALGAGTVAVASFVFQGLRPIRRPLPNLPDEVVADVWRGHSAQADAVQLLKKAKRK